MDITSRTETYTNATPDHKPECNFTYLVFQRVRLHHLHINSSGCYTTRNCHYNGNFISHKHNLKRSGTRKGLTMAIFVFLDTETTGVTNKSRILEIAVIVWDSEKRSVEKDTYKNIAGVLVVDCCIITPSGFDTIPRRVSQIHGITFEKAVKEGLPGSLVLSDLMFRIRQADAIVGHNVQFDIRMIIQELNILGRPDDVAYIRNKRTICTLKVSRTKQPNEKKHSLNEVHKRITGTSISNAHTALADTEACLRVYIGLTKAKKEPKVVKSTWFSTFKAPLRR
jgi:DNA polymerase-3 subunit epsilon